MKRIVPEYEFSAEQLNKIKSLSAEVGLLEETVAILYGRGIDDRQKIESFINPSRRHFVSPFKMQGMTETVELIKRARDEDWVVVVYGDYDADGICAATIMGAALRDFGIEPVVYVPERREGYGITQSAVDTIFEEYFPQLVITVDCGISCAEEVEYIKEQGAEVIVTDHHELPENIPDCICVNPKFDDGYIYDNLCGAGVALKVAIALNGDAALKYLDFAAIATVADSVPLTGENRDIVYEGLKLINKSPRKCYSQFFVKNEADVTSQTIAFSIAPKINAAGRMGNARAALDLFSESDESKIFDLAAKLTAYNLERQKCCDELYLSAKSKLKERGAYGKVIMLFDENWNSGFVGIVAARLTEEYSRPVLLFVRSGEMLKGSVRSIERVNIFEALKACSEYIEEFGGHAQAAGVNVTIENFDKLEAALNDYIAAKYKPEEFLPTLYVNGRLEKSFSQRFARELEMLEPFGVGNRRPMFELCESSSEVRSIKPQSPHISVKSDKIDLMYFGGGKYMKLLSSNAPRKYIFEYNVSVFRGREYVKGFIRDVVCDRAAGAYAADEIEINNIITLGCHECSCTVRTMPAAEIDTGMLDAGWGTVYIASRYSTLERYKNISKFPVELFMPGTQNLADTVIISPQANIDLSGFKKAVFLDAPVSGIRFKALEGKEVVICSDIKGDNFINKLSCRREDLLKIFSYISANVANLEGGDSYEISLKNNAFPAVQFAFALEVFRQLSLVSFDGGRLNVFKGIKTELTNSELYNVVCNAGGKL